MLIAKIAALFQTRGGIASRAAHTPSHFILPLIGLLKQLSLSRPVLGSTLYITHTSTPSGELLTLAGENYLSVPPRSRSRTQCNTTRLRRAKFLVTDRWEANTRSERRVFLACR